MKVGIVFPGQGSQYIGMGKDIYNNFEIAKQKYQQAEEILEFNLTKNIFDGEMLQLNKTSLTQPALFVTSIAMYEVLKSYDINVDFFAGHSLGEYVALVAANALSFEQGLILVKDRGYYMGISSSEKKGGMYASLGITEKELKDLLVEYEDISADIYLANINTHDQIVLSGNPNNIELLEEKANLNLIKLEVEGAFHSPFMNSAEEKLYKTLEKINFINPETQVISNQTAKPFKNDIKNNLLKQITNPVRWNDSIKYMLENNVNCFVELGPGKTLTNLNKKICRKNKINADFFNIEDRKTLNDLLEYLELK